MTKTPATAPAVPPGLAFPPSTTSQQVPLDEAPTYGEPYTPTGWEFTRDDDDGIWFGVGGDTFVEALAAMLDVVSGRPHQFDGVFVQLAWIAFDRLAADVLDRCNRCGGPLEGHGGTPDIPPGL